MDINLDSIGLVVGTLGTIFWAHNGKMAKYAAVLWFFSSVLWILFAWKNHLTALGARDAISVSLYLYGGYRWLRPSTLLGPDDIKKSSPR